MGLDYGTHRIGVALSDRAQLTAQPHAVLDARAADLPEQLRRLADEYDVERVIVGLPISLSGREGPAAAGARRLANLAAEASGLPVEVVDERFTTRSAEEVLIRAGVRRRKRREVVDKVAAAVMLQQYLDRRA